MSAPLLTASIVVPIAGAALASRASGGDAARRIGIGASALAAALGLVVLASFDTGPLGAPTQFVEIGPTLPRLGARYHVGVDGMSALLVAIVPLLVAALLIASPRRALGAGTVAMLLALQAGSLGVAVSLDAALLLGFAVLALFAGTFVIGSGVPGVRRAYLAYGGLGVAALLGVTLAVAWLGRAAGDDAPFDLVRAAERGVPREWQAPLLGLVLVAGLARMGAPPLHSWLPLAMRDGSVAGPALLSCSGVGLALTVRLSSALAPEAVHVHVLWIASALVACALHAAVVALTQEDLRAGLGFVGASHAALWLAGALSHGGIGDVGALAGVLATTLATTGLALVLGAVAARTGTTRVGRLGGLVRALPRTAGAYFAFAFAQVGLPGTLAFVAEDLVQRALADEHWVLGGVTALVLANAAVALVRGGIRAFFGLPRPRSELEDLVPRERGVAFALGVAILILGVAPSRLLAVGAHGHGAHAPDGAASD